MILFKSIKLLTTDLINEETPPKEDINSIKNKIITYKNASLNINNIDKFLNEKCTPDIFLTLYEIKKDEIKDIDDNEKKISIDLEERILISLFYIFHNNINVTYTNEDIIKKYLEFTNIEFQDFTTITNSEKKENVWLDFVYEYIIKENKKHHYTMNQSIFIINTTRCFNLTKFLKEKNIKFNENVYLKSHGIIKKFNNISQIKSFFAFLVFFTFVGYHIKPKNINNLNL
jgi:hypothetical protein